MSDQFASTYLTMTLVKYQILDYRLQLGHYKHHSSLQMDYPQALLFSLFDEDSMK